MATLSFHSVHKICPKKNNQLIDNFDLEVNDGEFIVVLGPPGCGKSTLIRMAAGLESITGGSIKVDQHEVNRVKPCKRDLAVIFENYALYPHMTVSQNMAYGLRIRKYNNDDIQKRLEYAAHILDLYHLLDRKPHQLSDDQLQLVGIGRAVARYPKAFLFDEPLSRLDTQVRARLRMKIKLIHQRLKTTTIYATNDPIDAMTLAQRIVIMNKGVIEQVGSPIEVFNKPANMFVASYLGLPPMNIMPCIVDNNKNISDDSGIKLQIAPDQIPDSVAGKKVYLGIRPEHTVLHANGITLLVELVEVLGSEQLIHCTHGDTRFIVRCPISLTSKYPIEIGEAIQVGCNSKHKWHWFDKESGLRIDN